MRVIICLITIVFWMDAFAQSPDPLFYQDLKYRMIGPFRAGRTVGAMGIASQPNVFFVGVNNGGVWKTNDFGSTWIPIFDEAPTGSVGDIAVSQTNPEVIYVGTGEGLHRPDLSVGDGIFKTENGGNSWQFIGLEDVQQVARIIVHPTDPDIVFVAGLGHPYGANEMRGVFRSVDGGATWEKVLYVNQHTGAIQVEFDPTNPQILYASLWEHQEGPWENAQFSGKNSGLYKSIDGGSSWSKLNKGLPGADEGLGRIGIGIAPNNPQRIYASVDARSEGGIYRSDDGGEHWTLIQTDRRLWGRGSDFAEIKVHPLDENIVYVANIASYKSTDGGANWQSIKGAPGGDDYHRIWINPTFPDIMLFAADQGATITVNGGKTWSSWYNQPTSQLYHVSTDNQFPYWIYGGQQESGAIGIASRGNGGQISFRDWMGVGADEYAYVAVDPKNSDIIFGGRVLRFDKKTGQTQYVGPEVLRSGEFRYLRTMPLMFHPADDHALLFATNVLWITRDEGQSWKTISPDLTRMHPEIPSSIGDFSSPEMNNMARRAIIYALGPSSLNQNIIWAGTDDGLVHVTVDGGESWTELTPPGLSSWDKISQIEAGHFDENTAYVAVNAIRKDNMKPLIYKTHDLGRTWTLITNGMNPIGPVNVVREDLKKPGLLFAGTEREVYFSVDDGENWSSLRMNMPATSIRDLVIHENDLVIGTHGRSIWIMDDINPLRNLDMSKQSEIAHLMSPSIGIRVRDNMFGDTPLPPEEPTGENPPDGLAIDYFLNETVNTLKIEILDIGGTLVHSWSSENYSEPIDTAALPHPTYWMKPEQQVHTTRGHHRLIWNLRYNDPKGAQREFSIAAVKGRTPSHPVGPFVAPGNYILRLIVGKQIIERFLTVKLDPRVKISSEDLYLQTSLSLKGYISYNKLQQGKEAVDNKMSDPNSRISKTDRSQWQLLRGNGNPSNGDILYGSIRSNQLEDETVTSLQSKWLHMLLVLQSADRRPTDASILAVESLSLRTVEIMKLLEGYRGN